MYIYWCAVDTEP